MDGGAALSYQTKFYIHNTMQLIVEDQKSAK